MAVSIIYKFTSLLWCVISVHPSKLNVPHVLLPLFSDFATNFTMEATEGGCYKWTTTRVDIIQLIPYETPGIVEIIEKQNKRGHIVLLEGIKTGSAKVSVRLPHLQYKDLEPCEVHLAVIENLLIMPADVYIMMLNKFNLK